MNYLVDTNVISDLAKSKPNVRVMDWFSTVKPESLFLSTLTVGEIVKGIERTTAQQQTKIKDWLSNTVLPWFEGRILAIDEVVAMGWGELVGRHSRTLPAIDGLLAATAITHRLTFVTRNVKDFSDIAQLNLFNPFAE